MAAVAALWPTSYGRVLAVKLLLVLTIVALSLYHDLVIGPRAARALEVDTTSGLAQSLRRQAAWLGRLNALLSLLVLTLALLLVRGVPL